jgi:hypothetical protein
LTVRDPDLIVDSGGRMRNFTGRAYLPDLVPASVSVGTFGDPARLRGCPMAFLVAGFVGGCGGGGNGGDTSSTAAAGPAANVQAITVNAGPTGQFPNSVMTSVTICVPGRLPARRSTTCRWIRARAGCGCSPHR